MRVHWFSAVRLGFGAVVLIATSITLSCSELTAPIVPRKYIVTAAKSTIAAGDTVAVRAQLADANDRPVSRRGLRVSWFFNGFEGRFTAPLSLTDDQGVALNSFVAGTSADVTDVIAVVDENQLRGDGPRITVVAGPPSLYRITSSATNVFVGNTVSVSAQLADKFGNAVGVGGRVVTWSTESGGGYYYDRAARANRLAAPNGSRHANESAGTFASPTSTTNIQGVATVDFNVGTLVNDSFVILASDDQAVTGSSAVITVHAGPIAKFVVTASVTDPPAGASVALTAYGTDSYDNRISLPGVPVNWSVIGSGGSLSQPVTNTSQDGTATNLLTTSSTPGTAYTVTAGTGTVATGTSATIVTQQQVSLAALAAGFGYASTCGIAADGNVWCWGSLAGGFVPARPLPGKQVGNQPMSTVSVGMTHSCGISAGTVMCWGVDDAGQLGDNARTSRSTPAPINSPLSFTAVSAGLQYTCALATTADIYCWGSSGDGRLGDGTGFTGLGPIKVAGGLSFTALSAGRAHTCAITTTGDAYCWGSNQSGELGNGSFSPASAPTLVIGGLKFTAIAAGDSHTCGISSGSIYCWGDNSFGELGDGGTTANLAHPTPVKSTATFVSVAAGGFSTCAIASDGTGYCWGSNSAGELGDPGFVATRASVPNAVSGGLKFKSIALGGAGDLPDYYYGPYASGHTCGLTIDGITYCWGSNSSGELGIGTFSVGTATPTRVAGQH